MAIVIVGYEEWNDESIIRSICGRGLHRVDSKRQKVTTHTLGDWVVVDVGENGSIVGFEILDASRSLDIEQLKKLNFVESGPPRRWKPVAKVTADKKRKIRLA